MAPVKLSRGFNDVPRLSDSSAMTGLHSEAQPQCRSRNCGRHNREEIPRRSDAPGITNYCWYAKSARRFCAHDVSSCPVATGFSFPKLTASSCESGTPNRTSSRRTASERF